LNIKDFVVADFVGFEGLIDKIGGVEIDIKPKEVSHCEVEKSGLQLLNGKQALAYSRLRKVGNADFERTERQRRVLNEIYKNLSARDEKELPNVIKGLLPYVETSLNLKEMRSLASEVAKFQIAKLEELRIPGDYDFKYENIGGASYLVPDMEESRRKLQEFIYGGVE
jgi:polyisoprenyl-teichoic acid--peptidoglycan teichoic acid transferase